MEKLFALLELDEGFRSKPYKCSKGKLTIGIGFNIEDMGLPREVAIYWLNFLIERDCLPALRKIFPKYDSFTENRKNALASMIYQLGETKFRLFRNTIALVNKGDWKAAGLEAGNSAWAKQTPNRARRITLLIQNG